MRSQFNCCRWFLFTLPASQPATACAVHTRPCDFSPQHVLAKLPYPRTCPCHGAGVHGLACECQLPCVAANHRVGSLLWTLRPVQPCQLVSVQGCRWAGTARLLAAGSCPVGTCQASNYPSTSRECVVAHLPHQPQCRSTLDFPGKNESDILLAECGCVIPTRKNGLSDNSLVRAAADRLAADLPAADLPA